MPSRRTEITAQFPGAEFPVGSRIRFPGSDGSLKTGTVAGLRVRHAEVVVDHSGRYAVPYSALRHVESPAQPECTLEEVETLANRLLDDHRASSGLSPAWQFGFDLAPTRAGVCHYTDRRISLSVSYCLHATRAEIEDTVLHEIAHAIVGHRHNHDATWKAKALEIGCAGERCHRVEHSAAGWVGECGCGQQWFRHRLQRRMLKDRVCAKCRGVITWRRNTEFAE